MLKDRPLQASGKEAAKLTWPRPCLERPLFLLFLVIVAAARPGKREPEGLGGAKAQHSNHLCPTE